MINTINTKQQQLSSGYFRVGTGNEVILVIGSCRCVPYLNYFALWNNQNGNRFSITFIDPFNFNYDLQDNRIDLPNKINSLEKDENILELLKSTSIFVHEFYSNFGMFNCDKKAFKNIYQFGLKPGIDICIPNFNDNFILFGDIISLNQTMKRQCTQDFNVLGTLSPQTENEMYELSQFNLQKFYDVCMKSDIPEMKVYFELNFKKTRFHHNSNHVSKYFTIFIFTLICTDILKIDLSYEFLGEIGQHDMYANNFTPLTEYDVKYYGYSWPESIVPLKELL